MADIDQRIQRARDELKRLQRKQKDQARRDETRRKILYGVAVLSFAQSLDETARKRLLDKLHRHISEPRDRDFLGLPKRSASRTEPPRPKPDAAETAELPFGDPGAPP